MNRILLLLLLANFSVGQEISTYSAKNRLGYLKKSLQALGNTSKKKLIDASNFISSMAQNKCRSDFLQLKLSCLSEVSEKNCQSLKYSKRRRYCRLYSDIIIVNVLSEKKFVVAKRRYELMKGQGDYREKLRRELNYRYATIAAEMALANEKLCNKNQWKCLSHLINQFCLDYSDRMSLSWNYCASALVWNISWSSKEK